MRILKDKIGHRHQPEDTAQRLFVQAWHSFMHIKSLDSHRVRCMNPLNITRELLSLIARQGKLPGVEKDIAVVSKESLDILKSDLVIERYFQWHMERLEPFLKELANGKNKQKEKKKFENSLPAYYLKDFGNDLEKNFRIHLIAELEAAIFDKQDQEEIFHLTGTLLSVLVDHGHSMGALFSIVDHILCREDTDNFHDRFHHLKSILAQGESDYEITFRLIGFRRYNENLAEIGRISFVPQASCDTDDTRIKEFTTTGQNVVFARTITTGLDAQSAGLQAKQQIDNLLDLIRFELEGNVVKVDERFIARKKIDDDIAIFRLPSRIPNPSRNLGNEEFLAFLNDVEYALEGAPINAESRKKITSAFRFYRMGRDTPQYENKFINWWTALEYLLRTGEEGSIITEIEEKLSSALLLEYTVKHLKSYLSACAFCGVDIGAAWISPADFFKLIHDKARWNDIKEQMKKYPILLVSLEKFRQHTKNHESISTFFATHENHLRWHIHRLWRMRCDIVHSAEYAINLTLLSANLEYYLKTLLAIVLKYLRANPRIESLSELFARIDYSVKRLKESLKNGDVGLFKRSLQEIKI